MRMAHMIGNLSHAPLDSALLICDREISARTRRAECKEIVMTTATPTLSLSFVAKLVAKPDTADEVRALLESAVELANQEAGTVVWFALRTDATTFWIVDAFASEADRQAHINGPIAAALMENADRLLANAPEILPADVVAAKVP